MAICPDGVADLHMAKLMPLPLTVSCSSKIQIGILASANPGSPGKRAVKRVCVCVLPMAVAQPSSGGVAIVMYFQFYG